MDIDKINATTLVLLTGLFTLAGAAIPAIVQLITNHSKMEKDLTIKKMEIFEGIRFENYSDLYRYVDAMLRIKDRIDEASFLKSYEIFHLSNLRQIVFQKEIRESLGAINEFFLNRTTKTAPEKDEFIRIQLPYCLTTIKNEIDVLIDKGLLLTKL